MSDHTGPCQWLDTTRWLAAPAAAAWNGRRVAGWLCVWLAVHEQHWVIGATLSMACLFGLGYFYDSERTLCSSPLAVVAPVDGRVASVELVHDEYLDRNAVRIRVRTAALGAYCLRAPIEGKLREARSPEGDPSEHVSWIQSDEGDDVLIAAGRGGLLGQRPCMVSVGERVGHGRRCGLRRLARHIDVYVDESARIKVGPGQRVQAGQDVLATLVRKSPATGPT